MSRGKSKDTSVDLVLPDESLIDVFGPLPTRTYRGEWAPVGHRKTQYRQLSRDYAPVKKLEMSDNEIELFSKYGLANTVKFSDRDGEEFFWNPREPNYTIHRADNALGLAMIIVNMQSQLIGACNIYFTFEQVYQHPVLVNMWFQKFSVEV
jgi:hypothetical protein